MSLRSKCDRAIAAYARGLGVCAHVYPANSTEVMTLADGPVMVVKCSGGHSQKSGLGRFQFQVQLSIHSNAIPQPEDTNPEARRVELDAVTQAVYDAFMLSDDGGNNYQATADAITAAGRALTQDDGTPELILRAANNADMAAFTLDEWYEGGMDGGNPKSEDGAADASVWMEILTFNCVACGANIDD